MSRMAIGSPRRVVFLDEMRGLCILLMILYHGLYDLVYLFGVDLPFHSLPFQILQLFICCNFIFISGISSRFSRNNVKRGLIVFLVAVAMSLVTWFVMPQQLVLFGILHFLGISMILHGLLIREKQVERLSPFLGLLLCLVLFGVTWGIPSGYVGFFGLVQIPLPSMLYSVYPLFPLGLRTPDFYSSDYFPLLPWVFLFFAGSYLGIAFRDGGIPQFFYRTRSRFLRRIGKHTLIIYVLHQPVLYGLLTLVFMGLRALGFAQ